MSAALTASETDARAAALAAAHAQAHAHYDSIDISEIEFDADRGVMHFPCPCGDIFELTLEAFIGGNSVAECPTCSLTIAVVATADQRAAFLAEHSA